MGRYQFVIGGIDRTTYVRPGVSGDQNLGDKGRARLTTIDQDGLYAPGLGDTVLILDNAVSPALTVFEGVIERLEKNSPSGTSALDCTCQCTDAGVVVDRRVVIRSFPILTYGLLKSIVQALVDDELADEGYTFDSAGSVDAVIGEIAFTGVTLREAFNSLAKIAGVTWRIFADKSVRFFTDASGYEAAPADITDALENYVTARTSQSASQFANRIYAKSTRDVASTWTDTHVGNGVLTGFATTYALHAAPVVEVNGVAKVVIESARLTESPVPAYDWYWIQDGIGVFQDPTDTPLTSAQTITISYKSPLPYLGLAESPPSIAAHGLFERLVESSDARDKGTLDDLATEELARLVDRPYEIEIVTREDGFAPGQLVHVEIAQPPINGDYICQSVTWREVDVLHIEYTLRLNSANVPKATIRANPAEYFNDIVARTRLQDATVRIAYA